MKANEKLIDFIKALTPEQAEKIIRATQKKMMS